MTEVTFTRGSVPSYPTSELVEAGYPYHWTAEDIRADILRLLDRSRDQIMMARQGDDLIILCKDTQKKLATIWEGVALFSKPKEPVS